jgi:hypothetical protein
MANSVATVKHSAATMKNNASTVVNSVATVLKIVFFAASRYGEGHGKPYQALHHWRKMFKYTCLSLQTTQSHSP